MNTDRHTAILELCEAAEYVLFQIPLEIVSSREHHFAQANLWALEIESTCSQVIQYYRAISILINQELPRPAAALARSIHEACFRLNYLEDHAFELKDWEKWQIARDYQIIQDYLLHGDVEDEDYKRNLEDRLKFWECLLAACPRIGHWG